MPAEDTIEFSFENAESPTEGDPNPGANKRAQKSTVKDTGTKLPASGRRKSDIERELQLNIYMLSSMGGQLWSSRDDVCGPILVRQSKDIAEALAEIIGKRPELARKLLEATNFSQYMKLFMAIAPVVQSIGSHHIVPAQERVAAMNAMEGNLNGDGSVPFPH